MSEPNFLYTLGAFAAGGGISIVTRIVFDWLQKGKNGSVAIKPDETPPIPLVTLPDCRDRRKGIDDWRHGVDKCLTQHKAAIQQHEKSLDRGLKDFEEIKKGIANLDKSYALLATKIGNDDHSVC